MGGSRSLGTRFDGPVCEQQEGGGFKRIDRGIEFGLLGGGRNQDGLKVDLVVAVRKRLNLADGIARPVEFGVQQVSDIGDVEREADDMDRTLGLDHVGIDGAPLDPVDEGPKHRGSRQHKACKRGSFSGQPRCLTAYRLRPSTTALRPCSGFGYWSRL